MAMQCASQTLKRSFILTLILSFLPTIGWGKPTHTHSSHPTHASLQQTLSSRQALQRSLRQELQQLKEREEQNQHAIEHARLSQRQLEQRKRHQQRLTRALARTQARLDTLTTHITQLNGKELSLQHEQNQQTLEAATLLPALHHAESTPEDALLQASTFSSAHPFPPDPALALSLLQARALLNQKRLSSLQDQRDMLQRNQEQLDQKSQTMALQQQKQQQQRDLEAAQRAQAERQQQQAEKALAHSRSLLEQARQNMQSLNNAIDRLARQEAATRQRLRAEARRLRRAHDKRRAHQAEKAAHDLTTGDGVTRGHGTAPVQGSLLIGWQQNTESGPSTGLTYRAAPSSPVSAPCTGRLLFTGDFRSFGPMVILDCGHQQRFVLAGFGYISTRAEQAVQKNALLGTMPKQGGSLFVQLRHGTRIIDPSPFLSSR